LSLDDPAYVERQYETEERLRARKAIYDGAAGVDARDVAFDAVSEADPRAVLEVGCGEGELAERIQSELGVELVALDQSARMVELCRERGLDARVGDVQELPFEDGSFDVGVAAWMLFHVPDLDQAIGELARVLRPGGRLVAVTNYRDHLIELFDLAGAERFELPFGAEKGADWLGRHFGMVERRDAEGTVTLSDADRLRSYLRSSDRLAVHAESVPELDAPLVARRRQAVFVATKTD
jgi:SAM-dependent methyltransferase